MPFVIRTCSGFKRLAQLVLIILLAVTGIGCGDSASADHTQLVAVAHGNGTFVAVGHRLAAAGGEDLPADNALAAVSNDGENWSTVEIADEAALFDVAYGNGQFVAVGGRVTGTDNIAPTRELRILTSPDGLTWTRQSAGPHDGTLLDITYGGGSFVAAASGDIMHSSDGVNWQFVRNRDLIGTSGLAFDNGEFFAWGSGGSLFQSADGITWSEESVEGVWDIWHLAPVNGQWFGAGVEGISSPYELNPDGPLMLHSTDLSSWTMTSPSADELPRDFAYGAGSYVSVFHERAPMTSADGASWSATGADEAIGTEVMFAEGKFVTVGPDGIFTSSDGKNWKPRLQMDEF